MPDDAFHTVLGLLPTIVDRADSHHRSYGFFDSKYMLSSLYDVLKLSFLAKNYSRHHLIPAIYLVFAALASRSGLYQVYSASLRAP